MTESSNTPATEGDLPNGGLPSYNFETAGEALSSAIRSLLDSGNPAERIADDIRSLLDAYAALGEAEAGDGR